MYKDIQCIIVPNIKKLEIYKYTVLKKQLVGYIHTIKLLCSHHNEILIDKEIHNRIGN